MTARLRKYIREGWDVLTAPLSRQRIMISLKTSWSTHMQSLSRSRPTSIVSWRRTSLSGTSCPRASVRYAYTGGKRSPSASRHLSCSAGTAGRGGGAAAGGGRGGASSWEREVGEKEEEEAR